MKQNLVFTIVIFLASCAYANGKSTTTCPKIFSSIEKEIVHDIDVKQSEFYRLSREINSIASNILNDREVASVGILKFSVKNSIFFQKFTSQKKEDLILITSKEAILLAYKKGNKKPTFSCSRQILQGYKQ